MVGRNASEGIEPRNSQHRTGPRVSSPGSQQRRTRYWRVCGGVPGSESVAGHRTAYVGTWETRAAPDVSAQQAGEARKAYGGVGVGPTHSRGVAAGNARRGRVATRRGWQQDVVG